MATLVDFMPNPAKLIEVLEVGRVVIGDFTDAYYLFLNITPMECQEVGSIPFAMFDSSEQGYRAAKLLAAMIMELSPRGDLNLPDIFEDEVKTSEELQVDLDPGADGNTGTISDDQHIRILGQDGHYLDKSAN